MHKYRFKNIKVDDFAKIKFVLVLLVVVLAVSMSIPSLARFKNYVNLENMFNEIQTWDGSVATSYTSGSGTEEDPFIISNASELAFFAQSVNNSTTKYEDVYFELGNHIVVNDGLFGYDETNVTYASGETAFYLDPVTGNVYETSDFSGNIISSVKLIETIKEFKGHFDGNYYTIYGLYIAGDESENAFVNTLIGSFKNVYFENAFVYGGSKTSILANNVINSNVNDVLVDGIVIGTDNSNTEVVEVALDDVFFEKGDSAYSGTVEFSQGPSLNVTRVKLSGNFYSNVEDQIITINGSNYGVGDFVIELDPTATSFDYIIDDLVEAEISITNLKMETTYEYAMTSGVVSYSEGTTYTNVINKADVYGNNASGLFGMMSNSSIIRAYNTGNVKGTNAAVMVGHIIFSSSSVIDRTYNTGSVAGDSTSYIDTIYNSSSVNLSNSFNVSPLGSVVRNSSDALTLEDVYFVSDTESGVVESVNYVTKDQLNKELMVSDLGMNAFVDNDDVLVNADNAWIYAFEEYPILYMDSLNNPIASINVSTYSWNDVGFDLKTISFTESKAFNVTPLNGYSDFENVYYYIHNDERPLSGEEIKTLEWKSYTDVVTLDKEGYYVVYVKIVDQENRVYYLNSDCLFFDLFGPEVELTFGDVAWDSYKTELDSKYISDSANLTVVAHDNYSDIAGIYYNVSDISLTLDEVKLIDEWNSYESKIEVNNSGINVVNVKAVDVNGHETYINSDYIIYGGYDVALKVGMNSVDEVSSAHITDKSSVTYEFTYTDDINYADGYNSNFVVSSELPVGTVMTLIDRSTNGVYSYTVKEKDGLVYPLNRFVAVGNISKESFDDVTFIVSDNKKASLIIDFSKATISDDFTFNVLMDLRDVNGNIILSTLNNSLKDTTVYAALKRSINISSDTVIYGINYDSNSKNVIDFEYELNSLEKNKVVVTDTYYDHMKTGIAINLVDEAGNVVDKKYLKNIEFIVNDTNYSADSDGVVRINMANTLDKVSGTLTIVTHENDLDLKDGDYSLVITPFIASDGKYTSIYSDSNVSIPVVSDYQEIFDYEFNVDMDDTNKILNRFSGIVNIPFDVVSKSEFKNPSVRVSLYKKVELTAYDQSYSIVDLKEYVNDELKLVEDYAYLVESNEFSLNFDLTEFDKTGYEVRFELFDGDMKIETIKKKFIVK